MLPYVTGDRFETNESCRPGRPNPTRNATMMIGVPRKKSVYATAKTRNGAAPRPGRPRTMAMPRASTRTSASAITIIRMFTWKPAQTSGSASLKLCGLKNLSRTSRRAFISSLLQYGHLREVDREPLLLQLRDRPVRPQRLDRRVDHRLQLRALLEHRAVLLVRDDLSRNGAVLAGARLTLARDDRRVEDQRRALVDLHGRERGRRRRIGKRRLRRMELRLDPVEAGRVRLRAGLHLLQVREAARRRRLLREQHALVRVEVARREVDGPLALRGDRRLLERDVELLRAGSEEAVPRREDPVDLADLQVRGDRFREIDLVALRVRDLVAADGAAGKADRGIAEGDREGAGVERRGCRRSGRGGHRRRQCRDDNEDRDETLHRWSSWFENGGKAECTAIRWIRKAPRPSIPESAGSGVRCAGARCRPEGRALPCLAGRPRRAAGPPCRPDRRTPGTRRSSARRCPARRSSRGSVRSGRA